MYQFDFYIYIMINTYFVHATDTNGGHPFYKESRSGKTNTVHVLLNEYIGIIKIHTNGPGVPSDKGGIKILWLI